MNNKKQRHVHETDVESKRIMEWKEKMSSGGSFSLNPEVERKCS